MGKMDKIIENALNNAGYFHVIFSPSPISIGIQMNQEEEPLHLNYNPREWGTKNEIPTYITDLVNGAIYKADSHVPEGEYSRVVCFDDYYGGAVVYYLKGENTVVCCYDSKTSGFVDYPLEEYREYAIAYEDWRRAEWEKNGKPYHKALAKGDKFPEITYSSHYGKDRKLRDTVTKKTLLIFSRYYECDICKKTLDTFKKYQRVFRMMGIDIKFIIQSDIDTVSRIQSSYPFEIISDPDAVFYDMFNIFEANSMINMVAGDKMFEEMTKGDIRNLLDTDLVNAFTSDSSEFAHRELQLSAFIGIDKNLNVIYSHYCKTIGDFPEAGKLLGAMRKS